MWLQSCFISTNHAASLNVCLMQSPERHSNSPRRLNQQAAHSHSDAIKVDIEKDESFSEGFIQTACRSFLPSHHQNGHNCSRLRARCSISLSVSLAEREQRDLVCLIVDLKPQRRCCLQRIDDRGEYLRTCLAGQAGVWTHVSAA